MSVSTRSGEMSTVFPLTTETTDIGTNNYDNLIDGRSTRTKCRPLRLHPRNDLGIIRWRLWQLVGHRYCCQTQTTSCSYQCFLRQRKLSRCRFHDVHSCQPVCCCRSSWQRADFPPLSCFVRSSSYILCHQFRRFTLEPFVCRSKPICVYLPRILLSRIYTPKTIAAMVAFI